MEEVVKKVVIEEELEVLESVADIDNPNDKSPTMEYTSTDNKSRKKLTSKGEMEELSLIPKKQLNWLQCHLNRLQK